MNPVNNSSYRFLSENCGLLSDILSNIASYQFNLENQQETNDKIRKYCHAIIWDIKTQPLNTVDGFLLLRSMRTFIEAGVEGFKEGKTAIRECYNWVFERLPDFQDGQVDLENSVIEILAESYAGQSDISAFIQLFQKVNHLETIPSDVFSYLVHFDKLDASMIKMLYTVLSKSGAQINEHFLLLGKCLYLQHDLGLTHRHLLNPSEDDTIGYSDEESGELGMVIDYKFELQVMEYLEKESDGGYFLLKKAALLSKGGGYDLLTCIKVIKNIVYEPGHQNSLIETYLQIASSDRMDVLMEVLTMCERWKLDLTSPTYFKKDLLIGVGAIPPERRETILKLLPTYESYVNLSRILAVGPHNSGPVNGAITAYLLYPYLKTQAALDVEFCRKIFTSILWEKLLDHSLPVFTLTSLAWFAREIGVPGYHPLRLLGNIMRTSGSIEPARTQMIHDKLEQHFNHLSTYKCPLNEISLSKREIEDPEEDDRPAKKLHLG